tara:strand:+ start:7652 stop:9151 length:1500 start_codon:yes stop_codon:yes gene_type:complete
MNRFLSFAVGGLSAIGLCAPMAAAQSTAFTYQGSLQRDGSPANGLHNIRFRVFDDLVHGAPDTQIGPVITIPNVMVVDGLFSLELDLGSEVLASTEERYLRIDVQAVGDGGYLRMDPRQRISATPRAVSAFSSQVTHGLDLPINANGNNDDLNEFDALFSIGHFGSTGTAIRGQGRTSGVVGFIPGITQFSPSDIGTGVVGISRTTGVFGTAQDGRGVIGKSINGSGGFFETRSDSNIEYGLHARTNSLASAGLFEMDDVTALNPALIGRTASTRSSAVAVLGLIESASPGNSSTAVRGQNNGTGALGIGVWGSHAGDGWGVYGSSVTGLAGRFSGDVTVSGTLSKSGGSFRIDHPLDPEGMYLSHSFVESPDMKNIYDGVVTLDNEGRGVVTMPGYFDALNQEFRYQLTCVGGYAPVYIGEEIAGQRFVIAGGHAGLKVSWQVTGVRCDAWANQNRIKVEEEKSSEDQGYYINPEAFGKGKEMGIGQRQLELMQGEAH